MDRIIMAYDLTRGELPQTTRDKMSGFLREMATGYLERIDKQFADHKVDWANWQSHRIKLITLASFALGDEALMGRAEQAFRRHVEGNIRPGGDVVDFTKRDALHYVTYDLEPLSIAALTPYAVGSKTHEEFVHSKVKFDAMRAQAGFKEYSGPWAPAHSTYLYQIASALDPRYEPVLETVIRNTGSHPENWLTLLVKAGL
jgi:hypothetical protein